MYRTNIRQDAMNLIPGTSTLMFYLAQIFHTRRHYNKHHVILDSNHCILVL